VEGRGRGHYFKVLKGTEKSHVNVSQDIRSLGEDSNPEPPVHEAGVRRIRL
jgi:hypothetical protein